MSDPILLFLGGDIIALLLVGACITVLRLAASGFLAATLSGLGMLLCLPPLFVNAPATAIGISVGPPGLSLHLVLDALSALFLFIVLLAGTAIAAFQATTIPLTQVASVRTTVSCLAGAALSLLAADGVVLAIGFAVMCGAIRPPRTSEQIHPALLIPLLLLAAICLLTPSGFAPRFDTIHAVPADAEHATAATVLAIVGFVGLAWSRSAERCRTRDALTAGVIIPAGIYLLLRTVADLAGPALPPWLGFVLLLAGGAVAVAESWRSASHLDIDGSVAGLVRRQAALAMAGIGLALVARAADLPEAASLALAASLLSAIGGAVAGVLASLAADAMGASAGTFRLSGLGGLVHTMPKTAAALAAGLFGLSALPPGLGFASLWLLFESILSAPRTGGLLFQLPLALIGGAIALSAAVTAAAFVRLIGIALLGRPRTPLAAAARENKRPSLIVLLALSGLSLVAGVLPGPILWAVADPAIRALMGVPPNARIGLALLSPSIASPGYLALPVFALLALGTAAAMLAPRWSRREGKAAGLWADGMEPPAGLPFGEPTAQSVGEGFLPMLPAFPLPQFPRLASFLPPRPPSAAAGLWLLLAACGVLLLALAVIE